MLNAINDSRVSFFRQAPEGPLHGGPCGISKYFLIANEGWDVHIYRV
jgi:hypothetical protein